MKKIMFIAVVFSACITSPSAGNRLEDSVHAWMKREGNKPEGYKSLSFGKPDSTYSMPENFVHLREQGQNPVPVFSGYKVEHRYQIKEGSGKTSEKTSVIYLDSIYRVIRIE